MFRIVNLFLIIRKFIKNNYQTKPDKKIKLKTTPKHNS